MVLGPWLAPRRAQKVSKEVRKKWDVRGWLAEGPGDATPRINHCLPEDTAVTGTGLWSHGTRAGAGPSFVRPGEPHRIYAPDWREACGAVLC